MSAQHTPGAAADGKTELVNLPGYPLLVSAVEFNKAIAQRDELLAALKLAMPALEAMRKQWPRSQHDDSVDVVEVARAAIAKVKGGAA